MPRPTRPSQVSAASAGRSVNSRGPGSKVENKPWDPSSHRRHTSAAGCVQSRISTESDAEFVRDGLDRSGDFVKEAVLVG